MPLYWLCPVALVLNCPHFRQELDSTFRLLKRALEGRLLAGGGRGAEGARGSMGGKGTAKTVGIGGGTGMPGGAVVGN